ncbi:hypothetical protein CASFOL_002887 [Castilleja foliolosa]|uniref:Pentatricopeptide repeat-containing protein n=1 Tax=Castilleja foliolosa TaxID=1961234 RepID=A0ABD3EG98_9LAMI
MVSPFPRSSLPDPPPLNHHSRIALSFKYAQTYHHHQSPLLDTAVYNILCKAHQFDIAWQLISQMDRSKTGAKPDFTTFFVLIRCSISTGLTRTAIRPFYDMGILLGSDVPESHFSFCICYLLDTLCKYGYVKVTVEVFNKEKYRAKPDRRWRFESVIREAEKVFVEMGI